MDLNLTAALVLTLCFVAGFASGWFLAAAVAFYTMLSLAPLVVVVMAIAGAIFGREAARGELEAQMKGHVIEQAELVGTFQKRR